MKCQNLPLNLPYIWPEDTVWVEDLYFRKSVSRFEFRFSYFTHLDLLPLLTGLNELIKQIQLHCVFYFVDLLPKDDLSLIVLSLKSVTDCAEN